MSIKVAVRVRPFSSFETNSSLCLDMIGSTTRLYDKEDKDHTKFRDFTFDHSFWSHD